MFKKFIWSFFFSLFFTVSVLAGDVYLHFSDFGPPEAASGSATVMKNLQAQQSAEGMRSFLVLPEYDAKRFPNYKNPDYIIRIPRKGSFQRSAGYQRLVEMFINGEILAVHVHKEANFSRLGLSLAKKFHVPAVLTAHMMIGPFMKDHYANKPRVVKPIFDWLGNKVERDYMDFANSFDVVTAPTEVVKEYLIQAGVKRPIFVVPPGGVPIEKFNYTLVPDRQFMLGLVDVLSNKTNTLEALAENKRTGQTVGQMIERTGAEKAGRPRKYVVMLARLSTEKGIEKVLDAWQEVVKDQNFEYHFVLAGLGGVNADSKRIYEALQRHPDAGKTVHYVGSLNYDDIPRLLSGGDVVLSASRHETFGLSLIEAGAAGRPVVIPDLPAFRTFIKDGETGVFVPEVNGLTLPGALDKVFTGGNYERMSKAARANAELYSVKNVSAQTKLAYGVAATERKASIEAGTEQHGSFFQTPLTKSQLCRWIMINALTKP